MKTKHSQSTIVEETRDLTFPRMQKALTKLQELLKQVENNAGVESIDTDVIRCSKRITHQSAELVFEGSGFSMSINIDGKGGLL